MMGTYNTLMGSVVGLIVLGSAVYALIDRLWPVKVRQEVR